MIHIYATAELNCGGTDSLGLFTKIGFFEKQLEKSEIPSRSLTTATYYARARSAQEIDDLEERLREHEIRILQMNNSHETLQRKYLQLTELRHVLRETAVFFEQV